MAVIDLSIPLSDNLKLLPNLPRVSITPHFTHASTASLYQPPCQGCAVSLIGMPEHTGTHIDAPVHFIPGGQDISQIPVDSLVGEAVYIDASAKGAETPLTLELFLRYLSAQGVECREGDIVIIRCSTRKWHEEGFHAVQSLTIEVADYLVARRVKAVGVDSMAVDCLNDMRRPVHMRLLAERIIPIEGLANLDKLPVHRFQFIALPLMLVSASGSPTRAIAIVP
jgi:arylformamidase